MRSTDFSGTVRKKHNTSQILILSLFLLLLQPVVLAVEHASGYNAVFSPAEVTVGDRISYTVTVKHDPEGTVAFALPDSIRLLPFVLIDQNVRQPRKNSAVLHAELALFDIGEHALPPVTVRVLDAAGAETARQVAAPAGRVTVKALTDSSVTDLLPLKPLKQPYRPSTEYLYPVLVGVMVISVLFFIGYFMRKRTGSFSEPADPAKDALRKIRKLEKSFEKGMLPEECYEQLSFLIREYLEKMYRIKAFEEVTSEIEKELSDISVPHAALLSGVLHQADLVKFAESRPGKEECGESLERTKRAISTS